MPDIESSIEENSAFKSKPCIASEFEPSSDLGMSDQVVLSESSAHSPAEEERSVARIIPEHEAVMPALTDAKFMLRVMSHDHEYKTVEGSVSWDSKPSSTLVDSSEGITQNYDYMCNINELISVEEKGGIGTEPSHPSPSSLVSETFQSSYDMAYHSSIHYLLSMMHFEALEFEKLPVMFKSESPIESELESPTTQLISRISLVQSNYPKPTSALSASFALDRLLPAVNKPQRMPVHSARMLNLKTIRTSLRRSFVKFDGVERYALDVDFAHTEVADLLIIPVPLRDIHETSIQCVPKWDLGHLTGIFELKPVPASSYDFSTTSSGPQMSRIENPSCSMLINSEFDLSIENAQQVLDLALLHEGYNHSWMVMNIPESFEHVNSSLLTGVESSPPLNSVSYFDHSTKVLVFIQPSLSSQGEHIDYEFSVLLPAPIFNNDIQRVCPLFIYLVIWAPKDYIAGTARYFYGVQQVKVNMIEVHIYEFSWNHIAFMI